jgi:NDP-sugar pyrophosphorylase family protein
LKTGKNEGLSCDALVLAAGFGTRLRPLTETLPKPLLEVGGESLLSRNLRHLKNVGFEHVFVNAHYLAGLLREYLGDGSRWGLDVTVVEESVILDTGGAIRNIQDKMRSDTLLTINSDVLLPQSFSLRELIDAHCVIDEPFSTMLLRRDKNTSDYGSLGVSLAGRVVEFLGETYVEEPVTERLMFAGVQILSSRVFNYMPPIGSVFSITRDTLREALKREERVEACVYEGYWNDVGTLERYEQAERDFCSGLLS